MVVIFDSYGDLIMFALIYSYFVKPKFQSLPKKSILLSLLNFVGILTMPGYSQRVDCSKSLIVNEKLEFVFMPDISGNSCNVKIKYDAQNRPIEVKKQAGNSNCLLPGLDMHRLSITYELDKEIWTPTINSGLPSAMNLTCGTLYQYSGQFSRHRMN